MPNFLEQLVAEWYEYNGYFVRRNVLVGPRPNGGYECELDVVAFHPEKRRLVHLEPSMDAASWATRERRYKKKFDAGDKHIPNLFQGVNLPSDIEKFAVLVFGSKANHQSVGGGKILLARELLTEIFEDLNHKPIYKQMVPEQFPVLRSLQFVAQYRDSIWNVLDGESKLP